MTIITATIRFPLTDAALPLASRCVISASNRILMSGAAVSIPQLNTAHILSVGNWLKMPRIDTREPIAKMVKFQAIRDRTNPVFVGPAMSANVAAVNIKHTVQTASASFCSKPQPACTGLSHLGPETILDRNIIPASHDIDQYTTDIAKPQGRARMRS